MTFSLIWTALSFTNIFLLQGVINKRMIEQRNEEMGSTSMYEIFFIRIPLRPKGRSNYKGVTFLLRITNFTHTCPHTYTCALMRS